MFLCIEEDILTWNEAMDVNRVFNQNPGLVIQTLAAILCHMIFSYTISIGRTSRVKWCLVDSYLISMSKSMPEFNNTDYSSI